MIFCRLLMPLCEDGWVTPAVWRQTIEHLDKESSHMTRFHRILAAKPSHLVLALLLTFSTLSSYIPTTAQAADGDLDASFAGSTSAPPGVARTNFGANHNSTVLALGIQHLGANAGKIVAAGADQSDFALARYTTAGLLDSATFGTSGITTTSL